MLRYALPILALTLATGAAVAGQSGDSPKLTKALQGLTAGEPLHCVPRFRVTEMRSFDGTILYYEGRHRVWRNDVQGKCTGLKRDDLIVTRTTSGEYCRGDIVETRSRTGGNFTGSCALGDFVPYRK